MMKTYWTLSTARQPLEAFRAFLKDAFHNGAFDVLLVPIEVTDGIEPCLLDDPGQLSGANPFAPLMTMNAARLAVDYLRQNPAARLAVVMRPCELRALNTLTLGNGKNLFTIGVDCLGTFNAEAFEWRGGINKLTAEVFQFARQGGVAVFRYRDACQMCTAMLLDNVDLAVHLLGVPAREALIVAAGSQETVDLLQLPQITSGKTDSQLLDQHNATLKRIQERRARAHERITDALQNKLTMDVDELMAHLQSCGTCRECLQACAYFSTEIGEYSVDNPPGREEVTRWLASCAGCGLCQEACPEHLPLTTIIARIRDGLLEELTESPA